MVAPLILTAIPYADDRNFGKACNEFMQLLPDDGWGCVLDHDVMFTTQEWHRQMSAAVQREPKACFAAMTNRIRCPFQRLEHIDPKNHDYAYHRQVGAQLAKNDGLRDVTAEPRTPAGFFMLLSKQAWKDAGHFPEGLHYLDRIMWLALKLAGRRILLIEGLYLYHWHRGANEPIQRGEWVIEHKLPNGKGIRLQKTREELPVYTG